MKIAKNCIGVNPDNTVFDLFSDDYLRVIPVELTPEQARKLAARKGVEQVSYYTVWLHSDEPLKRGVWATEVKSVKEL